MAGNETFDLMPENSKEPFSLAMEIKGFLEGVKDQGTHIDHGGGEGCGNLWVTVQGKEYFIEIKLSNKEMAK